MFIDASAIVAILARESDAQLYKDAIDAARPPLFVSPIVVYEAAISLARAKQDPRRSGALTDAEIRAAQVVVAAFIEANSLTEISISPDIGRRAVEASARFGKAVGHRADLNFGDCFAYACANFCGIPLLFKGEDFSHTDITSAMPR
jgi:ribonuclease VapC